MGGIKKIREFVNSEFPERFLEISKTFSLNYLGEDLFKDLKLEDTRARIYNPNMILYSWISLPSYYTGKGVLKLIERKDSGFTCQPVISVYPDLNFDVDFEANQEGILPSEVVKYDIGVFKAAKEAVLGKTCEPTRYPPVRPEYFKLRSKEDIKNIRKVLKAQGFNVDGDISYLYPESENFNKIRKMDFLTGFVSGHNFMGGFSVKGDEEQSLTDLETALLRVEKLVRDTIRG